MDMSKARAEGRGAVGAPPHQSQEHSESSALASAAGGARLRSPFHNPPFSRPLRWLLLLPLPAASARTAFQIERGRVGWPRPAWGSPTSLPFGLSLLRTVSGLPGARALFGAPASNQIISRSQLLCSFSLAPLAPPPHFPKREAAQASGFSGSKRGRSPA